MSGDQQAPSFGDPNAQPPTPKQTPTSTVFPSPVFETPKTRFDESGSWTPQFAEEYSVFNSTPGNLRGSSGPFVDFGTATTPYPTSAGHKRPLSAEGIAAEIAAHVNHFSPAPNLPLPPVEPSRRLPSSPTPLNIPREYSPEPGSQQPSPDTESALRSAKKPRRDVAAKDLQTQTATPPPSARKGERRLAPKPKTGAMQDEHDFGQPDFTGTPQQPNMATFVTTPSDVFGYPLSAPATAPANFWDPSAGLSGMDLDFTTSGDIFQTPTPAHRQMGSFDWSQDASQLFPAPDGLPQQPPNQEGTAQTPRRGRPIAAKAVLMSDVQTTVASATDMSATYPTPIDDPFGIVNPVGGVDPGLLFSRPVSANMDATSFNAVSQPGTGGRVAQTFDAMQVTKPLPSNQIRRASSVREMSTRQPERAIVSSPIKPSARPGLGRSFSENRGKKGLGRGSLPALAPAVRPVVQQASGSGVAAARPVAPRPSGRTSPLKQHQRLTSIPESASPRTRTSVKFTIDARGRARAETTVVVDEPTPGSIHRRRPSRELPRREADWDSSEDESSTDDEPIIIPSRNTSFALPDPRKPTSSVKFHQPQRSISERSTSTLATFNGDVIPSSQNDESEAETVMNDGQHDNGDATSELLKVKENRQKRAVSAAHHVSGGHRPQRFLSGNFGATYHANAISPTTITDASLPTPSSTATTSGHGIRCVCGRDESDGDGDGFMIQCESCEMWLHGRCINISRRTLPSVYICAFCAQTPNMRGGRIRDTGRGVGAVPSRSAASPLAHKSFKAFR